MYLTFFGFTEKPFNLTPDPKFLYLNASYREALAALRYGINERKGFVSLIGEAGTGKTTLLRRLLAELGPDVRSVLILNPAVSFDELLVFILTDLGHAPAVGTPKLQLLQALNGELLDTLARGGNVVVLIDEAQDLSIAVLEELRLLSNLETAKEKILQFVLAGQPELDAMLARPELRQLRQRIAVPARLGPLARNEVAAYVAARISAAGGDARGLFSTFALRQLYRFSRGVPRLVNVAADSALVTAYAAGTRLVDRKIIREAIHDLRRGPYRGATARRWRTRVATIAIAGIIGATLGVVFQGVIGRPLVRRTATEPNPARGVTVAREVAPAATPAAALAEPPRPPSVVPHDAEVQTADADGMLRPPPSTREPKTVAPAVVDAPVTLAMPTVVPPAAASDVRPPTRAPAPLAVGAEALPPVGAAEVRRVFVQAGDDLTHIARRNYGYVTQELLESIQRANPELVNLDIVDVGQTIILPPNPRPLPAPLPESSPDPSSRREDLTPR